MKLFISDSYETMSKKAAEDLKNIIQTFANPLICTASGDSPKGLYKELVDLVKKDQLDISKSYFLGLDEWVGMYGNDEGSCRYYLNKQLFNPLQVNENKICFFNGRAKDLESECDRVEKFINKNNGIDVAIVGLGQNGHVGMNEPGTSSSLHSHVADIATETQQIGQKYFKEKKLITKGLTLGIANLMEAKNVILLVSGNKKAAIVKRILEEEISEQLPASFLRLHKNFIIYLDAEAASLLQKNK